MLRRTFNLLSAVTIAGFFGIRLKKPKLRLFEFNQCDVIIAYSLQEAREYYEREFGVEEWYCIEYDDYDLDNLLVTTEVTRDETNNAITFREAIEQHIRDDLSIPGYFACDGHYC